MKYYWADNAITKYLFDFREFEVPGHGQPMSGIHQPEFLNFFLIKKLFQELQYHFRNYQISDSLSAFVPKLEPTR